ncbi:MAG: rRNA methyltransferase [Chlorobi bacterium]|nr:rRNA methyltransferase [Chlorobiota bacterium]
MGRFQSNIPALYLPSGGEANDRIALPEEESRHVRALRLRAGDPVLLLDGAGGRTDATVERMERGEVIVRVRARVLDVGEGRPYIALGIGLLADKSRLEWTIEKGVELGAREIIPISAERAEGRFQHDRALRIAVAALKQSQGSFLPTIADPTPLARLLERLPEFERACLCHESAPAENSLARFLISSPGARRTIVLIGPEGGFTDREVSAAREASADIVSLGDTRLRSETAAIVALALIGGLG